MADDLTFQERLYFAALLETGLREEDARAVAVVQSRVCGDFAISPAEIDIHIPGHTMSMDEQMWVSDFLDELLGTEDGEPSVACPICGIVEQGTIAEMGLFLLGHRLYHTFEQNNNPMRVFGADDDGDTGGTP